MFAERLKKLRSEKNMVQKDIAKVLNITTSAYGFYEQGKRTPDQETLIKLADFFDVSIDYLLGKTDIRNYAINEPTVALHSDNDYDDLPQEAKDEINNFIDYIRSKYKKDK